MTGKRHYQRIYRKMKLHSPFLFSLFFGGFFSVARAALPLDVYSTNYWEIAGSAEKMTWVEIHNRQEAKSTGIAHIEVLARRRSDPVWEVQHVCFHMAITTDALRRSVLRPVQVKSVYPETYEAAFARWKLAAQEGSPMICTTSIEDYLKHHP
jgi:hypothetical protein